MKSTATLWHLGLIATVMTASGIARADIVATYTCKDGHALTVTFTSAPAAAKLVLDDGLTLVLPQVLSADGGHYAEGDVSFWIKGNSATFDTGSSTTMCQTKP